MSYLVQHCIDSRNHTNTLAVNHMQILCTRLRIECFSRSIQLYSTHICKKNYCISLHSSCLLYPTYICCGARFSLFELTNTVLRPT